MGFADPPSILGVGGSFLPDFRIIGLSQLGEHRWPPSIRTILRRPATAQGLVWYSLSEGIDDGMLKNVAGNIRSDELDESNLED